MNVYWSTIPSKGTALPFNGQDVVLAVPCQVVGGGLDPTHPFIFHIAYWRNDSGAWITNKLDDETGKVLTLRLDDPSHWAALGRPQYP